MVLFSIGRYIGLYILYIGMFMWNWPVFDQNLTSLLRPQVNCWHCVSHEVNHSWFTARSKIGKPLVGKPLTSQFYSKEFSSLHNCNFLLSNTSKCIRIARCPQAPSHMREWRYWLCFRQILQNPDGRATLQYYIYTFIFSTASASSFRMAPQSIPLSPSELNFLCRLLCRSFCQDGGMRPLHAPLS